MTSDGKPAVGLHEPTNRDQCLRCDNSARGTHHLASGANRSDPGCLSEVTRAAWLPFVARTFGPLVGADLLHLHEAERMDTGIVSIDGAGTFDGILLSGIVALYLA